MSASSNCVTRGIAFQLWLIRRLMVLRSALVGFRVTGPHLEKSIVSAGGGADRVPAVPVLFGAIASFSRRCT